MHRLSRSLPAQLPTLAHDRHAKTRRDRGARPAGVAFVRYLRTVEKAYWRSLLAMVRLRSAHAKVPDPATHFVHVPEEKGMEALQFAVESLIRDPSIQLVVICGGTGYAPSDLAPTYAAGHAVDMITMYPFMFATETLRNVDAADSLPAEVVDATGSRNVILSRPYGFIAGRKSHRSSLAGHGANHAGSSAGQQEQEPTVVVGCPSPPNAVECALNAILPSVPSLIANASGSRHLTERARMEHKVQREYKTEAVARVYEDAAPASQH